MTRRLRPFSWAVPIIVIVLAMLAAPGATAMHRAGAPCPTPAGVCASLHGAHAKLRNRNALLRSVASQFVTIHSRRKAKLRVRSSPVPAADLPAASSAPTLRRFAWTETSHRIGSGVVPHDYDPQGPPPATA